MQWIRQIVVIRVGLRSRLCEGKVLTPLTSIVLDGNHLVNVCLCAKENVLKSYLKERKPNFYFLKVCSPRYLNLVPTYSPSAMGKSELT